jgi:hypothetical protein
MTEYEYALRHKKDRTITASRFPTLEEAEEWGEHLMQDYEVVRRPKVEGWVAVDYFSIITPINSGCVPKEN